MEEKDTVVDIIVPHLVGHYSSNHSYRFFTAYGTSPMLLGRSRRLLTSWARRGIHDSIEIASVHLELSLLKKKKHHDFIPGVAALMIVMQAEFFWLCLDIIGGASTHQRT